MLLSLEDEDMITLKLEFQNKSMHYKIITSWMKDFVPMLNVSEKPLSAAVW
jgi:hypothetical protein